MLAITAQPSRITVAVQGGQTRAIAATGEYSFVINSNTSRLIISPGVLMPSNLQVTSGSNGSDIGFSWSAGAGAISYIIEVHDNIGLRRTWTTISLSAVYTATMAVSDGGHKRSYTIKIAAFNSSVGRSDFAELLVENAAPATPAGVRVVEQFSNFIVSCQNTLEGDYAGMIVWAHTSAGVPLDDAHKVYDGYPQSAVIIWPAETPDAYFVVARYDSFGKVDLNTSSEFAGTLLPAGGIVRVDTLPGTTYLDEDVVYYSGDQSLYWWDESLDPDAYVRALPLVVANQIYSIDLKTISATIGELNLGRMNVDAYGYIRGGQSGYATGSSGFYLGYSGGAYRFSLGTGFTYDGTALTIGGTASIAGTSASTVVSNASTALTNANAAQTSANTANSLLADIASDSKLTPDEKTQVRLEWDVIAAEKSGINTSATNLSITTENTNYNTAFQTLANYLNTSTWSSGVPLWISDAQLGTTTTIVGSTFRTNWKDLYDKRQILLNKIAEIAATKAIWTGVSGTGKPADNATVGAQAGTNLLDSTGASVSDIEFLNNFTNSSQLAGDLTGNPFMVKVDPVYDRPAGIKAGYGNSDPLDVSYADVDRSILRIKDAGGTDDSVAAVWPAFRVQANMRYRVFLRWRATGATAPLTATGIYMRFLYKTAEIAQGKTHIAVINGESGVDWGAAAAPYTTGASTCKILSDTSGRTPGIYWENLGVPARDTWYETVLEWSPTDDGDTAAVWASFAIMKWTGFGAANSLEVESCFIYAITSAANNADVTNAALETGTTITGGGITLSGGGAIKTFGKDSASNTTAGFFLGWDTSAYQFAIGNAAQNMKWNGSTLSFTGGGVDVSTTGNVRGGQTNYNTGTGFFLGYSGGAYKLSIGNPAGNRMMWDGSALSIAGAGFDVSTTGNVRGGQTNYNTGTGFFLGYSGGAHKFSIGNPNGNHMLWDGTNLLLNAVDNRPYGLGNIVFANLGGATAQSTTDVLVKDFSLGRGGSVRVTVGIRKNASFTTIPTVVIKKNSTTVNSHSTSNTAITYFTNDITGLVGGDHIRIFLRGSNINTFAIMDDSYLASDITGPGIQIQ